MNARFLLAALTMLGLSGAAHAAGNFTEFDLNATTSDNDFGSGVEDRSQGMGVAARGRWFLEGDYFLQGEAAVHFTDGSTGGANYDLDSQLYRLGLGAQDYAGSRDLLAAFWVEVIYDRIDIATSGGDRDTDNVGGAVQLRFDRASRDGRFLPYLQLGYLSTDDFDGAEARLGARLNHADIQPYADVRYLDRDGDDAAIAQVSFAIGARLPF
ncbi:MAG: hypothetical protein MRY71_01005 [Algiphilus sp.]|nr:hypothetical protein [Algiphilus sp.]